MCQHNLPCSIVYAHCLLPGRAFASLYVLLFLEKEAEIGGRVITTVNSEFFAKALFSRNYMRSFVKIMPSQNGKITLSFTDLGKSCHCREFNVF